MINQINLYCTVKDKTGDIAIEEFVRFKPWQTIMNIKSKRREYKFCSNNKS